MIKTAMIKTTIGRVSVHLFRTIYSAQCYARLFDGGLNNTILLKDKKSNGIILKIHSDFYDMEGDFTRFLNNSDLDVMNTYYVKIESYY